MPSSERSSRAPSARRDQHAEYYYRRPLGLRELLPAVGVAIGAGLFAFYVTRLLLQRTPLNVDRGGAGGRPRLRDVERQREA
jgi:hypothetical protein